MSLLPADRRPGWREILIVAGIFLVLTVAMTWPMTVNMQSTFALPSADYGYAAWNLWWTSEALFTGQNPFHTDMIYHPEGCSLLWRQMEPFLAIPMAPITRAFGTPFAYNLAFLSSFVLAALGAYLLARYLTGSKLAAFGAGLVYSFHPLQFVIYSTLSYAHIQWLPFIALSLLLLKDEGRLRHGVWAGVWLSLLLMWSSIYYGIYGAIFVVLAGLWFAFVPGQRVENRKRWFQGLGLCVATAFVLTAFRFIPMALEAFGAVDIGAATMNYGDVLGLRIRLGSELPQDIVGWPSMLGYVAFFGAIVGGVGKGWKQSRFWWLAAVVFFSISLGRTLSIAGKEFPGIPMPVDLMRLLPLLSSLRVEVEAIIVVTLALAVMFAYLIARVERSAQERSTQAGGRPLPVLALALLGLCLVEYWPPRMDPYPDTVPAFYRELAQAPGEGAVLPIPVNEEINSRAPLRDMFLQTVHGRPILSGHVGSRPDPRRTARYLESEFLALFYRGDRNDPFHPFPIPDAATAEQYRQELRELGVEAVVLHKSYIAPEESERQPRGRLPVVLRWNVLLAPLWWGPIASNMIRPPDDSERSRTFEPGERAKRLDPSVVPFLEAVLGPPDLDLSDGSVAWRLVE